MKNKIFKLILILLASKLMSFQICIRSKQECRGHYDSKNNYLIKCQKYECQKEFNQSCGLNYCSSSEQSCENFNNLRAKILARNKHFSGGGIRDYKNFIINAKKCSFIDEKLTTNDVCIRNKICVQKNSITYPTGVVKFYRKVDCKCNDEHSYICQTDYCSKNENKCEQFKLIKANSKNESLTLGFKYCYNHHIIENKQYAFF